MDAGDLTCKARHPSTGARCRWDASHPSLGYPVHQGEDGDMWRDDGLEVCASCSGNGYVLAMRPNNRPGARLTCSRCGGKGVHLWRVYIVSCSDGSLYCGIAKGEVERRVKAHNSGKGAKYTRSRRPVRLVASWGGGSQGDAMRLEVAVKRLRRSQKDALLRDLPNGTFEELRSVIGRNTA